MSKRQELIQHSVSRLGGQLSLSLYFLCAVGFWGMALLLFDPDQTQKSFWVRSDLFFVRLIWFEALFAFAWFGAFISPIRELFGRPKFTGGVPVAIAATVCNAALLSMAMLAAWLFLPRSRFCDNLPVALQILILLVCVVKVVLLRVAGAAQLAGMDQIPVDIKTPDQLSAMLTICLKQPIIEEKYYKAIERCKNKVDHSFPRVGKISKSQEYREFARKTEELYDTLMNAQYEPVGKMVNDVEMLIGPVIRSCKN